MEIIREGVLLLSAVIGGLFIGAIAGFISIFVIEIADEILSEKAKFLVPGVLLIAYFGAALFYTIRFASSNAALALASVISYELVLRSAFSSR